MFQHLFCLQVQYLCSRIPLSLYHCTHNLSQYYNFSCYCHGSTFICVITSGFLVISEGGRLEKELEYTRKTLGEGSGTTYELILQTPKNTKNLLNLDSLLLHYHTVLEATKIEVEMDGM